MQIRTLTVADLPRALVLLDLAGLAGAKANLARYLRVQPDCGWCAIDSDRDGELLGLVTLLRQGSAAFVGAMAVLPARRGGGIGRRLLEHAHAYAARAGIATLLLEATALGERLYRKLGYVGEHATIIVGRAADAPLAAPPTTRIAARDHAAFAALDRAATGVVRDDLLAVLHAEAGPGATVAIAGELAAAGMIVGDRLGPVYARDPGAGRAIVDRLASACRTATVPMPNTPALAALEAHGFGALRELRRMRCGPPVTMRVDWLWALASPGAG